MNRPDILKMWINAIGKDFKPRKSHLICSAHFVVTDFMERPNASGVRLKNLAVPSIFFKASASIITPVPANVTTSAIKSGTTLIPTSEEILPAIVLKSILKPKEDNSTFIVSNPPQSSKPASTSTTVDTIKMTMRKPRKIMDSSILSLKKQEMTPREKLMRRTIKLLRQKLTRKEEKIQFLQNLLKHLKQRYDKKSDELI